MIRTRIAVVGLLAIALLTSLYSTLDLFGVKYSNITAIDRHVSQVAPGLPSGTTAIGYMSDADQNAVQEYYLMQYALAPIVVSPGIKEKYVLANIHNASSPIDTQKLEVVHDYGSGIELLRNKTR